MLNSIILFESCEYSFKKVWVAHSNPPEDIWTSVKEYQLIQNREMQNMGKLEKSGISF